MGTHYTQLTHLERNRIGTLLKQGKNLVEVAYALGRDKSTVSRELKRNAYLGHYYFSYTAQLCAAERRRVASSRMKVDFEVWKKAEAKLKLKWSPEQISERLKLEGVGTISKTTIYTWVWLDRKAGGELFRNLRISNRRRKKRNLPLRQRGPIRNEKSIETRPKIVERRERLGDLEGDTIHFSEARKAGLLTITDRVSKVIRIRKLKRRQAQITAKKAEQAIASMNNVCHTMTLDRGPEFAAHQKIEERSHIDIYFAKPYTASQRGSIENQNGLIRQFFPRDYPIQEATGSQIRRVETLMNDRPRKTLGYLTPNEFENNKTIQPAFVA